MKEEIINENGDKLVYGDDHIEGLFFEVWSYDGRLMESDSQMNNPLLTIKVIDSIVQQYGFNLSHELPDEVIEYD